MCGVHVNRPFCLFKSSWFLWCKKRDNHLIILMQQLLHVWIHPSFHLKASDPRRSCTLGTSECHEGSGSLNGGGGGGYDEHLADDDHDTCMRQELPV